MSKTTLEKSRQASDHDGLLAAVRQRLDSELQLGALSGEGEGRRGALYITATPIGNLSDITLRALAVLATSDVIYAEDTRHTGHLLSHFRISVPLRSSHDHNEDTRITEILERLEAGEQIALVSDAGTPLISDPGYKIVRAVTEAGHNVVSVPGASAMLTALTSSGLPTDTFLFAGFLPPKQMARCKRLSQFADARATLVFYEGPSRVAATLADMARELGEDRACVVARELTKRFEEVLRGSVKELAEDVASRQLKGEVVILVGPAAQADVTDDDIRSMLVEVLENSSVKDASKIVAEKLEASKSHVYNLALQVKKAQKQEG